MISITVTCTLIWQPHNIKCIGAYMNFEMSINEHVMISSDQRSSLCYPANLLDDEHWTAWAIHTEKSANYKIFQQHQLNSRRFQYFQELLTPCNTPRGFEAEVFVGWMPFLSANQHCSHKLTQSHPFKIMNDINKQLWLMLSARHASPSFGNPGSARDNNHEL